MASRPNILFVFADDWGRYASAYRDIDGEGTPNDLVDTPHFDRVAREGALFRNAFVPAPSCTPCRSSVLTGRYFWQTGRAAILQGARSQGHCGIVVGAHVDRLGRIIIDGVAGNSSGSGHSRVRGTGSVARERIVEGSKAWRALVGVVLP